MLYIEYIAMGNWFVNKLSFPIFYQYDYNNQRFSFVLILFSNTLYQLNNLKKIQKVLYMYIKNSKHFKNFFEKI